VEAKVGGHYVNSILACQDAKDKGYDEALYWMKTETLPKVPEPMYSTKKTERCLHLLKDPSGITRQTVLEICSELDIPVKETFFKPEEMRGADAGFFCGTAAEIVAGFT
jgi:branched-chain amino acid aminotransferase